MRTEQSLPLIITPNKKITHYEQYITNAIQRDARAEYNLGVLYIKGDGPPQNHQIARYWFSRAAAQGHVTAIYYMGLCYQHGLGVNKDAVKAIHWYRSAVKNGYALAENALAECYENGIGIDKNLSHALYWYQRASSQNEEAKKSAERLVAQDVIPSNSEEISKLSIPTEKKELDDIAISSYKEYVNAAEKGGGEGLCALAFCYTKGRGVEKNRLIAEVLFYKAAQQGNIKAIYFMGMYYECGGWLLPKNENLAIRCYQIAAKEKFGLAFQALGNCFEQGIGVEKNLSYALYLYQEINGPVEVVKKSIERLVRQNIIPIKVDIASISTLMEKKKIPTPPLWQPELPMLQYNSTKDEIIFNDMANIFKNNIKKCNIPIPLCFYTDPIPVKNFINPANSPLFIDLQRNRKPGERLFLLEQEIISEALATEAQGLQHLIDHATDALLVKRQFLIDQNKIQQIDHKLFHIVDKLLTNMLLNNNLNISLFAKKLGLSIAKDAIRCFHQNVTYLNHFLVMYAEYLFNSPLVLPKMVITNIGKKKGLRFTSYAKGFSCKKINTKSNGEPEWVDKDQLTNVEIAAKFNLIRKENKLELMPKAFTSDINLVKTIFDIFCVKQLKKYQATSDDNNSVFLNLVYTEMALALPNNSNFKAHLKKMASLPNTTESADKYLATLYLEKYKNEEIKLPDNVEKITKTTILDLNTQFLKHILQNSFNYFILIPENVLTIICEYIDFISPPQKEKTTQLTSFNFIAHKIKMEKTHLPIEPILSTF